MLAQSTMLRSGLTALILLASSIGLGCSGDDGNGNGDGSGASGGNGSGTGGGTSGGRLLEGVDGRRPGDDGSSTVTPVLPGDECAGTTYEGEAIPLDMLIMMDRSISMGDSEPEYLIPGGGTKWVAVREGFETFVGLDQTRGLRVGIDFFGQPSGDQNSCDPQDYATPDVDIATLPGIGPDILDAYDQWSPGGTTPIGPALEGAHIYARNWADTNPGTAVVVVLVTDGAPNGCGASLTPSDVLRASVDDIAQIPAAAAAAQPQIRTFVLGIEGQEVTVEDFRYSVNTIAEAGNGEAIVIQANDDLAAEFSTALDRIRGTAAPPCSYGIPLPTGGETLDLTKVNVALTPPEGDPEGILNVPDASQCEYGGWYYEPTQNPTSIELCPNTCQVVSQITGAGFDVFFGCSTQTVVR